MAKLDYFVSKDPIGGFSGATATPSDPTRVIRVATTLATYSATSNTFIVSGSLGARWGVFLSAATFYSIGSEPGAPGGGTTAINTAIGSWNNDPNSNVNYGYGGADTPGTHNGGLSSADGQNTIYFA